MDDEPFNIIAMQGQLEMFGIVGTDKAFNGKEALEKVSAREKPCCALQDHLHYTAVFLDSNMPLLNGIETAT